MARKTSRPSTARSRKPAASVRRRSSGRSVPLPGGALELIERRRSSVHGWGVFATRTIPKNKRIVHYAGEKIPASRSLAREHRYLKRGHIWCFKLNRNWVIDAGVGGNVARFINHSCAPNCYVHIVDGVIWIRAARTIKKREELSYNYNTNGDGAIPCRCRPGCKGML